MCIGAPIVDERACHAIITYAEVQSIAVDLRRVSCLFSNRVFVSHLFDIYFVRGCVFANLGRGVGVTWWGSGRVLWWWNRQRTSPETGWRHTSLAIVGEDADVCVRHEILVTQVFRALHKPSCQGSQTRIPCLTQTSVSGFSDKKFVPFPCFRHFTQHVFRYSVISTRGHRLMDLNEQHSIPSRF